MLNKEARFDYYCYRIATYDLKDPSAFLEEGSWVSIDTDGKIVNADGTKKAFLNLTSNRSGRDNVTSQSYGPKASFLVNPAIVRLQNNPKIKEKSNAHTAFDESQAYDYLDMLEITAGHENLGILTKTTDPDKCVAWVMGPVKDGQMEILTKA